MKDRIALDEVKFRKSSGSITPTDNFYDYNFTCYSKALYPRGKSVSSNSMRRKVNKRVTFAANDQVILFEKTKCRERDNKIFLKQEERIISIDPLCRSVRRKNI